MTSPVPTVPAVPLCPLTVPSIAQRLRTFAATSTIWEARAEHAQSMLTATRSAREAFIASLPELPVWMTERGEIGSDVPEGDV